VIDGVIKNQSVTATELGVLTLFLYVLEELFMAVLVFPCSNNYCFFFLSAIIYSFNVEIPDNVEELAKSNKVSVRSHNVIYKLVDDLKKEISSRLPLRSVEEILGKY
jgi:hypothetical protein